MNDQAAGEASLSRELSRSRYFAVTEPVVDVVETPVREDQYLVLARTIEREVIPRLLLKNRMERFAKKPPDPPAPVSGAVAAFTQRVLAQDFEAICRHVSGLIAAGSKLEWILIELLAPAARYLGDLWDSDACTFMDVTVALGKLQQVLRKFSVSYQIAPDPKKLGFCALLATVPSDKHIFGILIVEELFRDAGWNVLTLPSPAKQDLIDAISREWFAVVGLSVSGGTAAEDLAPLIVELRQASLNRSILVLAGGHYFMENPGEALAAGVDLIGTDARQAILQSQDFLKAIGRSV